MRKKELDEDGNPNTNFTINDFAKTNWPTWVGSFFSIFVLLWLGYRQLSLDPFEVIVGAKLGWTDVYLLLSGAAWDAVIFGVRWIKRFFKSKS